MTEVYIGIQSETMNMKKKTNRSKRKMVPVSVKLHARIKSLAEQRGQTITRFVGDALEKVG